MNVPNAQRYKDAIQRAGISIYEPIDPATSPLYIPDPQLVELLKVSLVGINLDGIPLRTRSKIIKEKVCEALGYPIPKTFTKVQPRFPGQNLDTYNQQALNLQIWNEPVDPARRYVLILIGPDCVVRDVVVVDGTYVKSLDRTGTLTSKYQATFPIKQKFTVLHSAMDTPAVRECLESGASISATDSPIHQPQSRALLPIAELFALLSPIVGMSFPDPGANQERNRGAALHRLVCKALGYDDYADNGQFPDVKHQLLEVKLQTSPTIDLGLVLPTSILAVNGVAPIDGVQPKHEDTRYALFGAEIRDNTVHIHSLAVVAGRDFFKDFRMFEGKQQNKKLQIPLPATLFRRG